MRSRGVVQSLIKIIVASEQNKKYENLLGTEEQKFEEQVEFFLENLEFDQETKVLNYNLIKQTTKPKITRYVKSNYVRTPIYGDVSVRKAVFKKFNKAINPIRFVSEEILKLNLEQKFVLEIIEAIGIVPEWRKKQLQLEKIQIEIKFEEQKYRSYLQERKTYQFKPTDLPEIKSNFWLRFFWAFFTFFFSFYGYISKKRAAQNRRKNAWNEAWNKKHQQEIDLLNQKIKDEIDLNNQKIDQKIQKLTQKYTAVEVQEIQLAAIDEENWIDLRTACNFSYDHLADKKGVYIIWNKTKNLYYVGQSKNLKKRLSDHFKNGNVNNVVFARDWYENDCFVYKYYFCETKDELDSLEKRYIEEYNSFENGYNKTKGNK